MTTRDAFDRLRRMYPDKNRTEIEALIRAKMEELEQNEYIEGRNRWFELLRREPLEYVKTITVHATIKSR